jgi:hypothetical protein
MCDRGSGADFLQYEFAQEIGIAFTGSCKLDDPSGDHLIGNISAACKSQRDASYFECDAHDAQSLGVEFDAV